MEENNIFYLRGIRYGYPSCCVEEFCSRKGPPTKKQQQASEGSGFIPCKRHTRHILNGWICIESLIQDRIDPRPFKTDEIKHKKNKQYVS